MVALSIGFSALLGVGFFLYGSQFLWADRTKPLPYEPSLYIPITETLNSKYQSRRIATLRKLFQKKLISADAVYEEYSRQKERVTHDLEALFAPPNHLLDPYQTHLDFLKKSYQSYQVKSHKNSEKTVALWAEELALIDLLSTFYMTETNDLSYSELLDWFYCKQVIVKSFKRCLPNKRTSAPTLYEKNFTQSLSASDTFLSDLKRTYQSLSEDQKFDFVFLLFQARSKASLHPYPVQKQRKDHSYIGQVELFNFFNQQALKENDHSKKLFREEKKTDQKNNLPILLEMAFHSGKIDILFWAYGLTALQIQREIDLYGILENKAPYLQQKRDLAEFLVDATNFATSLKDY